ncbi:MAG TPA: FimV/HubP family polar landmark protein [Burkholderiales bacterium]|nr:FimV/HubP family polar landmark protein [Burkholderiales bacterium]
MSALGEPLKAEVELVAEKNEIGSLAVRLANREAFERAGLTYTSLVAGIKATVEKRGSGEPYVQLVSTQPITEPFVDLLIELTWSSGRISREFTALLDPPAVIAERQKQNAAAPEVRAAPKTQQADAVAVPPPSETTKPEVPKPEVSQPEAEKTEAPQATSSAQPVPETAPAPPPASAPPAPVETIGGSQPTLFGEGSALPSGAHSAAMADAYGPVRSGDTLGKIALATKPPEFTLEQMLVLLTRNNPRAFSGKNMNRLKTGKILHLPTSDELASLSPAEASKEVKIQARDWRAYREQLAASAAQSMPADQQAEQSAAGKVGASTQEKAASPAEQPKEVLKLSKNEPSAGVPGSDAKASARIRALEEEVVAREKAVKESDSRVAKLEKQITDLKALLEMKSKSMADQQKPPGTPAAGAQAPDKSAIQAPAAPTPEATPAATAPVTPTPPSPGPKNESAPAPPQPQPLPPKPAAPKTLPAPPHEASLMDQVMDQPAYLGAAIGVLIIIGAIAVRAVKRRRESKSNAEESGPARAVATSSPEAYAESTYSGSQDSTAEVTKKHSEEVDPVAEAEIFLAYGRDTQAEELLKEALENAPARHEIRLKLLQIYANRKDAKSFEKVARDLQQATGGTGAIWEQAVALGYQLDPDNARYASGKSAVSNATPIAGPSTAENVDFNIGSDDAAMVTPTDIDLGDTDNAFARTQIIDPADPGQDTATSLEPVATTMDFNVDLPPVEQAAMENVQAAQTAHSSGIDFDIDLNALTSGPDTGKPATSQSIEPGIDFDMSGPALETPTEPRSAGPDIDLSGISLDLGTDTAPTGSPGGKDDHWYDVQTKFDLAKAYQEMGDKDGAREILKEVLAEGDAEQKTAANSVLSTLDS